MTPSQRLVFNTVATYGRSVIAVALILFSSRWVLNSLGQTDFGLFSVVGSIIIFITFINSAMANSVARYYAYSIGQGDTDEVSRWFNAALSLHLCLATILVLIGWPIGEYVIAQVLTVPHDRVVTCLWVFRVSLFSAFVSMVSIPCVAMFTAQQKITETAFWGIIQVVLTFTLAYCLTRISGDLLLIYAIGMVAIIVFVQLMMFLRVFIVFKECRLNLKSWFDCLRFRQMFSFAGWNMIGCMGATMRDQGSAILLNLYFGPALNSAFGISKQVSAQANQLSTAMMGAFTPEITASEGRGDRQRTLTLAMRASKYGTILVLLFAIPMIIEMDYILKIWLKEPPLYTAVFCRLILITFIIDRLSSGYMMAVNAHGKIAAYQATVGTSLLMTLPLAWLFVKMGYSPKCVCVAFIITAIVCSIGRALWGKRLLGISVSRWFMEVLLPSCIVTVPTTIVSLVLHYLMQSSFMRLFSVLIMTIVISLVTTWFFAFNLNERAFLRQNIKLVRSRLFALCNISEREVQDS